MIRCIIVITALWAFALNANENHFKMIPADMTVVVGINVEQVLAIPMVREQLGEEGKEELQLMDLTYDDIKSVTFAMKAASVIAMADFKPEGMAVFELKKPLQKEKLIASMEKNGSKVNIEKIGREILSLKEGHEDLAIVLEGNYVIAGSLESVRNSVKVLNGSADNLNKNTVLKKLLITNSMLYSGGIIADAKGINGFSLVCNYGIVLNLKGKLYCKSPEVSKDFLEGAQMISGMIMEKYKLTEKNIKFAAVGTAFTAEINLTPLELKNIYDTEMMEKKMMIEKRHQNGFDSIDSNENTIIINDKE